MITAAAGFHITLYSVPPMRLQRRPPGRTPLFPRSLLGGTAPWKPPSPFHPASSPPAMASALRAAAGGPQPANGPGEDQQHDDSGHDPRTTRACPSGSSSAPSDRSARRGFFPMIGCGLAAYISDTPRGGEREGARRLVGVERPAASATARSRSEGCGRSSRNGGPLPPFTRIRARSFARDDPELGH
jgi:hypothetical protein